MTTPTLTPITVWTDAELIAQFRRCVAWSDPDQWDALGWLYAAAGYNLNRNYCWRRADEIRRDGKAYVSGQYADVEVE